MHDTPLLRIVKATVSNREKKEQRGEGGVKTKLRESRNRKKSKMPTPQADRGEDEKENGDTD